MRESMKITLLVGGSIAAYKSAELARQLIKSGAQVNVVMSQAAMKFISPLTLETLTGSIVHTDMFDLEKKSRIGHIVLADSADVVVVAPVTADLIAKARAGMADDSLTAILLATKAPILFAPAMNVNMWEHPATQENVSVLKERGVHFVEPDFGELSCGWHGAGRLADYSAIVDDVKFLTSKKTLSGSHVVVTAGPTREWIDPIRFMTNLSSGKMGFALAQVARYRGATVSLVSGPTHLSPPRGIDYHQVSTAVEMHERVMELVGKPDTSIDKKNPGASKFVFMVAAVSDHRPTEVSLTKIKKDKDKSYQIKMEPNPDILQELGDRRSELEKSSGERIKLIGFTAETGDIDELLEWATDKLERKSADLMVSNVAQDAFGKNTNRVWLINKAGRQEEISTADKEDVADKVIQAALTA